MCEIDKAVSIRNTKNAIKFILIASHQFTILVLYNTLCLVSLYSTNSILVPSGHFLIMPFQ